MLPLWIRLHVKAVRRACQLILGEEFPLTAVKRGAEMTAVLVSHHAAVRIRTMVDRSVHLLQARFRIAVIPEAPARVLVVRANSLMLHVSHVIKL